jgi:signal transduction histidine kinase
MTAAQIKLLFRGLADTRASLDCVRESFLDEAASRRRGLETIAAKLAHELKNPLAAIKSLVQLEASSGPRDARSRRRFDVMASEVARMETILRDYLTFSRPLEELDLDDVNVASVVDDVIAVLAGRADVAGVRLGQAGVPGVIRADPRRLKEALINLTANAIEATPAGGSVNLRYDLDGEDLRLAIRDSGAGMTPAVATRVGTPFFTTRAEGTGLGVLIARSAIAQHGGTLQFASRPGGGTAALITLPRRGEAAAEVGAARG